MLGYDFLESLFGKKNSDDGSPSDEKRKSPIIAFIAIWVLVLAYMVPELILGLTFVGVVYLLINKV